MSPYRESDRPEPPTWWQGFRYRFGNWFSNALLMTILVTGWMLFGVWAMATHNTQKHYERSLDEEESRCVRALDAQNEAWEKRLKEDDALYRKELEMRVEEARKEAFCNYLGSTYHQGRCFDYEISTDRKRIVVDKPVRP